jgi:hypothetical protein
MAKAPARSSIHLAVAQLRGFQKSYCWKGFESLWFGYHQLISFGFRICECKRLIKKN